ncbi:MAG: hypothetical protein J7M08_10175 [Planctomycetes bacterium]|nr:hypothetical protein [Planctomycetota bacterium]
MIHYDVIPKTSQVRFTFEGSQVGECKLWLPEGVGTPRGSAGVYPYGMRWREDGSRLSQEASVDNVFGPGNVEEVEPGVLECLGIRYAKEAPLPWTSSITFHETRVDFSLSVHNPHDSALPDVCALLCFKFMDAPWWSPGACFFTTGTGVRSIAQTEWIEGKFPSFQKWHLGRNTPYDSPVKNGIWTSNPVRVTSPTWVVQHAQSGVSVVFSCESAYYIHCNRDNPCNDIAMKYGDIQPGQTVERRGHIELAKGAAEELFSRAI